MIGNRTTTMGDDELDSRKILANGRHHQLHKCDRVGTQIVGPCGVERLIATTAHMDHRWHVELTHLFVNGIPIPITQGRRIPVTTRWIQIEVESQKVEFEDATLKLCQAVIQTRSRCLGQLAATNEVFDITGSSISCLQCSDQNLLVLSLPT